MERPNVELKKVKLFQGMEGYGLNADVYINGVKCFMVIDEGNGGCFIYHNIYDEKKKEKARKNIDLLNEYIENYPPVVFDWGSVKYDMDMLIDEVLDEQEGKKAKKKWENDLLKLQEHALIFGNPNTLKYSYYNYKRNLSEIPKELLKTKLSFIERNDLKEGDIILNTNLKELGLL